MVLKKNLYGFSIYKIFLKNRMKIFVCKVLEKNHIKYFLKIIIKIITILKTSDNFNMFF